MRARVKVAFTDKENMTDVYYPGDMFEGSEERVNELIGSGHVETVDESTQTVDEPKAAPRRGRPKKTAAKE